MRHPLKKFLMFGALSIALSACNTGQAPMAEVNIPRVQRADVNTDAERLALGKTTTANLNARFDKVALECSGHSAAHYCSGVLFRMTFGKQDPWVLMPDETSSGGVWFNFLRKDIQRNDVWIQTLKSNPAVPGTSGMIFEEDETAIGKADAVSALCMYPYAFQFTASRADRGCGMENAASEAFKSDLSSCLNEGVTTGAQWVAYFKKKSSIIRDQCSFSTVVRPQFEAGIVAHNGGGGSNPVMIIVAAWSEDIKNLPVQAFVYKKNSPAGLESARQAQQHFLDQTKRYIPIVAESNTASSPFSYAESDNPAITAKEAFTDIAVRLNARYNAIVQECDGQTPAYYCSGVLARGMDFSTAYQFWTLSPGQTKMGSISFSYVRQDTGTPHLYKTSGMIMRDQADAISDGKPLKYNCIFPSDASTGPDRGNKGCNFHDTSAQGMPAGDLSTCDANMTAAAWIAFIQSKNNNIEYGCSFSTQSAKPFYQAILASKMALPYRAGAPWNELLIDNWDPDTPAKLPIEAFYYVGSGLQSAQHYQQDYFEKTQIAVPIVMMTLTDPQPFTYSEADQKVQH